MFTGIITDIGTVVKVVKKDNGCQLVIITAFDLSKTALGASIACNGACMTVTGKGSALELSDSTLSAMSDFRADKDDVPYYWFSVDVSDASLICTTLGVWNEGARINLEGALCLGDELGGHLVTGHVDGVGEVKSIVNVGDNYVIEFTAPDDLQHFIAQKGSVTVDGVSLTVNQITDSGFIVNLVPHTLEHTTLSLLQSCSKVNLEIDLIARYTARLLQKVV